jgi:2-aminoethylphosphonate aminotransferase
MTSARADGRYPRGRMILLNPGPANTSDAVKRAMTLPDICPREREFGDLIARVRDGVTRVVHQGDRYVSVLLSGSGTAGVEAAISSSVPADGRLLVIDNGSYGVRIAQIAAAYGIAHDVESFGVGGFPDLDRIARKLKERRYSQLAVVHHETSTGLLNPVAAIGALCRQAGVEMIVDAMSSYAGIPIDVETIGADFLISSSNKCIQGMAGLAFVICRRARLEAMTAVPGRSYYLSLAGHHRFFEQQRQMQFTPPVQILYALEQALDEYFAEGGEARHQRYVANWRALDSGMLGLGFRRLLPEAILSRILTSYIEPDHPSYSFDAMHDRLYHKGFTIYPGKGAAQATSDGIAPALRGGAMSVFRLANMGDVTPDDMHAFVRAMSETLEELGVSPLYASTNGIAPALRGGATL